MKFENNHQKLKEIIYTLFYIKYQMKSNFIFDTYIFTCIFIPFNQNKFEFNIIMNIN